MTVSSLIPPIVAADASIRDTGSALSFTCYWVIPFALLGCGAIASRVLIDRMIAEATSPHTIRRTTFLAFKELEIDQLFYLAQQKAEREVGAGMEPYDVKIGTPGSSTDQRRVTRVVARDVQGARAAALVSRVRHTTAERGVMSRLRKFGPHSPMAAG